MRQPITPAPEDAESPTLIVPFCPPAEMITCWPLPWSVDVGLELGVGVPGELAGQARVEGEGHAGRLARVDVGKGHRGCCSWPGHR